MPSPEIEEFARLLVHHVRDAAVQSCDALLQPSARSPIAARWQEAAGESGRSMIRDIIPDCVDETVFCLLRAIDQGVLRLKFSAASGQTIDLVEDGAAELAGWYMATGGWRAIHSTERFIDDFADLGGS